MLKNIKNNSNLIRLEEQAPDASGTEDPNNGGTQVDLTGYWNCVADRDAAKLKLSELQESWDEAVKMLEKYETAIKEIEDRKKELGGASGEGGIMLEYTKFKETINSAWTSSMSLNGYDNIYGEDSNSTVNCLKNFYGEMGTLLDTLNGNRDAWKKEEEKREKAFTDNEKVANQNCVEGMTY